MRLIVILFLAFLCWQESSAQKSGSVEHIFNTVAFYQRGDTIDTHEIRKAPEGFKIGFPYYESLGSKDGKFIRYEFFRLNPNHYYVQEYYKNGRFKSLGVDSVDKTVRDTVYFELFLRNNPPKPPYYLFAEHPLIKDGMWTEFENDTSASIFWRGSYRKDKKAGIWERLLIADMDTLIQNKEYYNKDSTEIIYTDNGIRRKTLTELKNLLTGHWIFLTFQDDGINLGLKGNIPDSVYWRHRANLLSTSNYQFGKSGRFTTPASGEDTKKKAPNQGTWSLHRTGDQSYVELIFKDGTAWQMELLYYSDEEGLVINLNKHPQITPTN